MVKVPASDRRVNNKDKPTIGGTDMGTKIETPQLEDGFTQIANGILDDLSRLQISNYAFRVLMQILRNTYGYQLKSNKIPVTSIATKAGIRKAHVSRALHELTTKNIITIKNGKRSYNKDSRTWKLTDKKSKYAHWRKPPDLNKVTPIGNNHAYNKNSQAQNVPQSVTNKKLPQSVTKVTPIGNKKLPQSGGIKEKKENLNKVIEQIFNFYLKANSSVERLLPARVIKISARLETFSQEEIEKAITICFSNSFYKGDNDRDWKANSDYIFRSDTVIDRFLNSKGNSPVETSPQSPSNGPKPTYKQMMGLANALSDRQIRREKGEKA